MRQHFRVGRVAKQCQGSPLIERGCPLRVDLHDQASNVQALQDRDNVGADPAGADDHDMVGEGWRRELRGRSVPVQTLP